MPSRSPETEVLLHCARQRITELGASRVAELCANQDFRWQGLHRMAKSQRIAPLVWTHLSRIAGDRVPTQLGEQWKAANMRNMLVTEHRARIMQRIFEFLGSRSIRVMLVKGAALDATVYDQPWYTQSADVDLLAEVPYKVLSRDEKIELNAISEGVPFELQFARHHDLDMNHVLGLDYPRIWRDAQPFTFRGHQTYIMSPEDMLLSACINLCRKRFRQLKEMASVNELIGSQTKLNWAKLAVNALECGSSRIVYASLAVARLLLGCEIPNRIGQDLRIGWLRRLAIQRLSSSLCQSLFQIPAPNREPWTEYLASGILRLSSYHSYQFIREVQATTAVRREKEHLLESEVRI